MDEYQKSVVLLSDVLIKFRNEYFIDPKTFLKILIKYFGSAEQRVKTEGYNLKVCEQVFKNLYPEG